LVTLSTNLAPYKLKLYWPEGHLEEIPSAIVIAAKRRGVAVRRVKKDNPDGVLFDDKGNCLAESGFKALKLFG